MKKYVFILLLLFTSLVWSKPRYATTIKPFEEILKAVVGDQGTVFSILPPGASPHTYELIPSDVKRVAKAKALFYGSPDLDKWALVFYKRNKIELMSLVPQEKKLDIKYYYGKNEGKTLGTDPHFWTDPLTVKAMLPTLTDTLCGLDPEGSEHYRKNALLFSAHLDSLNDKISELLTPLENKSVLLSHPFLQYYLKQYHFNLVGVIESVPGTEPTTKEIMQIIKKTRKEKAKAILTHHQHSDRPAVVIAESTGIQIYELDPIGGKVNRQTYDEILLFNTHKILEALQ